MASGYGLKVPDLLLYAALGVGAYFVYKAVIKPTAQLTETVGQSGGTVIREVGESAESFANVFQSGLNTATSAFDSFLSKQKAEAKQEAQITNIHYTAAQEATKAAVTANIPEAIQRQTEYGSTVGEWASKMFLPTTDVAYQRQQDLKSTISTIAQTAKNVLGISSTTQKSQPLSNLLKTTLFSGGGGGGGAG